MYAIGGESMNTNDLKNKFGSVNKYLNIVSLIVLIIVFLFLNPNFLAMNNITNILTDTAPLLLMAIGITFVLLLGSIDLSTGSICTCTCVITGLYIGDYGLMVLIPVVAFGLFAGLVNGLVFTKLKVPSFIATLCTSAIFKCFALILSGGRPKGMPIKQWGVLAWSKFKLGVIPIYFIIAIIILLICYFIEKRTVLGRSIFACGANEPAAKMMGLKIEKAKLYAFVICGVLSALSGFFYAVKLRSSLPAIGDPLGLLCIAAVALGGTSLAGGSGSVLKSLIGVLLVIVIQSGLNVIGVGAFWQQIVFGSLVIIAIFMSSDKINTDIIVK